MTVVENAHAHPPLPFGYFPTLGWALLSMACGSIASVFCLIVFNPGHLIEALSLTTNARLFSLVTIVSLVVQTMALALVVRQARWPVADYLGVTLASWRETAIAVACFTAFVLGFDALTYLLNRDIVTPFQLDIYRSARESGGLPLLLITIVLVAPAGEEIMFRGFLYRGWTPSPRAVLPAIVAISLLWSIMHIQYDWFGILQIFLGGLLLGWIRWRSGSTVLTFFLHGLMNAWATIETMVQVDWLS